MGAVGDAGRQGRRLGAGAGVPHRRLGAGIFPGRCETAIPAIGQLLAVLPAATPVQVVIEVADARARVKLEGHPHATVEWRELAPLGDALLVAVRGADLVPGTQVWVAGEAAGVRRIRRHLFDERGLARAQATVRGYWKHGRAGGADD